MVRFFGRRRARAARGQGLIADEQAVRTAEAIVGRAWAQELVRRREDLAAAITLAHEQYQEPYRRLDAARASGDPQRINLAHAALERALEATRAQAAEHERAAEVLAAQVESLRRATDDRLKAAGVRRGQPGEPAAQAPTATRWRRRLRLVNPIVGAGDVGR